MEKYSKEGLTIFFRLETRWKLVNTDKYGVKICVCYKRERTYYPTGVRLTIEEWESIDKTKKKELITHRQSLENTFGKIKSFAQKLMEEENFTLENLKKCMNA